ncbi:MAG TPA: cysteine dioxygenase family protein [Actinophytocola sp.]|uniref:cysteine dioxygenase n=1 Tax=Actinophytocola sp. TaxID=1872138 RepID=UPI002DDD65B3|nr:cysteine dioxygenase family protein [Actinophytocola sp.]HEV2782100.1 cysteine dioxygenase family protein [Actinophytocola sp.]
MTASLALRSARLDDLLARRGSPWTPSQLRDLTSTVAAELYEPLLAELRFRSPDRWWTRLRLTDEVELWLLSWLPGQGTVPHDHGGAAGAFTVMLGNLAETYRYPSGPINNQLRGTGSSIGFDPWRAHIVQNLGPDRAASVHAYSPPLVPMREYTSLRDIPPDLVPMEP